MCVMKLTCATVSSSSCFACGCLDVGVEAGFCSCVINFRLEQVMISS